MSDDYFTNVTAAIPTWAIKQSIVFVNPANPDDKMEFESIEAVNAEMFRLKAEVERLRKAGDALALSVGADWAINGPDDGTEPESVKAWNAAKEASQA